MQTLTFKEFYLEEGLLGDISVAVAKRVLAALKSVTSRQQARQIVTKFNITKMFAIKLLRFLKANYKHLYRNTLRHLRTPSSVMLTAAGDVKVASGLARVLAWILIEVFMLGVTVPTVAKVGEFMAGKSQAQLANQIEQMVDVPQSTPEIATTPEVKPQRKAVSTPKQQRQLSSASPKWESYTNSDDFVNIIKAFEAGDYKNFHRIPPPLKAYADNKQVSIGYGTKALPGETVISAKEAHRRLLAELSENRQKVLQILKSKNWNLKNSQINGLTDFAFNRGAGALRDMVAKASNLQELAADIQRTTFMTVKGQKVHSTALAERRAWETTLLLKTNN